MHKLYVLIMHKLYGLNDIGLNRHLTSFWCNFYADMLM